MFDIATDVSIGRPTYIDKRGRMKVFLEAEKGEHDIPWKFKTLEAYDSKIYREMIQKSEGYQAKVEIRFPKKTKLGRRKGLFDIKNEDREHGYYSLPISPDKIFEEVYIEVEGGIYIFHATDFSDMIWVYIEKYNFRDKPNCLR
ncbi:MAG: hypothetical protein Q7R99_00015 [bacterium]|nr:hypothetical protein [bacterium]